jgi:cystathionine beta-synthase
MLQVLEQNGKLKKGGTVVEASSGNTARSLAMLCALKGYKCVIFTTTKISDEKKKILELYGATVHKCPKEARYDAAESYYNQADAFAKETEGAVYINQYFNQGNPDAHYNYTGPEIWEQTEGRITHFVCCAGTGGTVSGIGKYLKEKNPEVKVIAVDAIGSLLTKYFNTGLIDENELKPYALEGVGKNMIPGSLQNEYIDHYVQVDDKSSLARIAPLARKEGLLVGPSGGAVLEALEKLPIQLERNHLLIALFPDHGVSYLSKL